jgi:hypothetical protein
MAKKPELTVEEFIPGPDGSPIPLPERSDRAYADFCGRLRLVWLRELFAGRAVFPDPEQTDA